MDELQEILQREDEAALPPVSGGLFSKLHRKFVLFLLLNENHPQALGYFPSRLSAREEKRKQFFSKAKYMIHPLSKFSLYYDMYLIVLYFNLLIFKGFCFGFLEAPTTGIMVQVISVLNVLSFIDIIINFRRGYTRPKTKTIELRPSKIALKYIKKPYFICDFLSSLPKNQICYLLPGACLNSTVFCIINTLAVLRLIRIVTFATLLSKLFQRNDLPKNFAFIFNFTIIFMIITHWLACTHYAIPRYVYIIRGSYSPTSWVVKVNVVNSSLFRKYVYCWFKSFGYTLGIEMKHLSGIANIEEEIFVILQYILGKIFLVTMWLILVHLFLLARYLHIKYQEIIDQIQVYMSTKKYPENLRARILEYYRYKYQGKFFNEMSIQRVLSIHLKHEIKAFSQKKFIESSKLFQGMPQNVINDIVDNLTRQIYLPKDVIVQSGTEGDGLYFLSEGTVAVYSKSGKEICHLQEGAHFGEVSLIFPEQQRNATVVAIETCSILKLDIKTFNRCFTANTERYAKLFKEASARLKETSRKEEEYKQWMFQTLF